MPPSLTDSHKQTTEPRDSNSPPPTVKNALPVWKARPDVPKEKELIDMVNETCKQLNIKKPPELFIFGSFGRLQLGPNAISIPVNRFVFTQSLLNILSHDQLRAVVAHEMTHRKHMVRDTTIIDVAALALIVASIASLFLAPVIAISLAIGSLIAIPPGILWYRRKMEREADLGAATVAGPQATIDSLRVLEKQIDEILGAKPKIKKLVKLVPPFLRVHPTFDDRIQNIREHTPSQDDALKKQTEEVMKNIQQVGSYTVSAMQSEILSNKIGAACALKNTTKNAHALKPPSKR